MTESSDADRRSILVLDAMGVMYRSGDDVAELLIPFIREKGGIGDVDQIDAAYLEASLGHIDAAEFWRRIGVSGDLEDEYLRRHILTDGLWELLQQARTCFRRVYCLSNDLSEWSLKLRRLFQLEPHIDGWYISGDLGLRKPDPRVYKHVVNELAVDPAQILFVDDRVKNLDPAAQLGIQTVHYDAGRTGPGSGHRTIDRLTALLEG